MDRKQESGSQEFRLPIELRTVLKALRLKLKWLILTACISVAAGVGAALLLGSQNYSSTTVLFFQPTESFVPDTFKIFQAVGEGTELSYDQGAGLVKLETDTVQALRNRANMVKTLPNLERLRIELGIEQTLQQLGAAVSVDVPRDTHLMLITVEAAEAETAMVMANTIRDIFLDSIDAMLFLQIEEQMRTLDVQHRSAVRQLEEAQKEFKEFVEFHDIRDIVVEIRAFAEELIRLELSLERSENRQKVLVRQIEGLEEAIRTARILEQEEQDQQQQKQEEVLSAQEVSNRIQLLERRIEDIRRRSTDPVVQERLETQLRIAENEYVRGLISRSEYEQVRYEYEMFIAQSAYEEEIQEIVSQIEELSTMPFLDQGESTAVSDYVKMVRIKLIEARMDLIEAEASYNVDVRQYEKMKDRHGNMPEMRQTYIALAGRVASLEAEVRGLSKVVSHYAVIADKEHSDFYVISDAPMPLFPMASNRRMIAAAGSMLMFILGFSVLLMTIVLDTRLKSAADARQKLQLPVRGTLLWEKTGSLMLPRADRESSQIERYRILARQIRLRTPADSAVLLLTSTKAGEGKSTVAVNLAAVYGRQDEHVLIINGQVRRPSASSLLNSYRMPENAHKPESEIGLGEYLSYLADEPKEIISSTVLPGVDMIGVYQEAVVPDLLQSARMQELMKQLKSSYSIIIIEGPPVRESVDSEILSQYCDTVYLVTACRGVRPDGVNKAVKRLESSGRQIEGIILTKVMPAFID